MPAPPTLVRPLADSRPPALTWSALSLSGPPSDQPTLDLGPLEPTPAPERHPASGNLGRGDPDDHPQPGLSANGVEVTLVRSRWCARPDPTLPDARSWGVSLAQALVETVHCLRPVAQLNRWVAEDVLAALTLHQRRRRVAATVRTGPRSAPRSGPRTAAPPTLRSVRLQHPQPAVVEVSAHVTVAGRSTALAFRLEGCGTRWLCTALELGPRVGS